jgi:hypothetical protein
VSADAPAVTAATESAPAVSGGDSVVAAPTAPPDTMSRQ